MMQEVLVSLHVDTTAVDAALDRIGARLSEIYRQAVEIKQCLPDVSGEVDAVIDSLETLVRLDPPTKESK